MHLPTPELRSHPPGIQIQSRASLSCSWRPQTGWKRHLSRGRAHCPLQPRAAYWGPAWASSLARGILVHILGFNVSENSCCKGVQVTQTTTCKRPLQLNKKDPYAKLPEQDEKNRKERTPGLGTTQTSPETNSNTLIPQGHECSSNMYKEALRGPPSVTSACWSPGAFTLDSQYDKQYRTGNPLPSFPFQWCIRS